MTADLSININDTLTEFNGCFEMKHLDYEVSTSYPAVCVILYGFLTLLSLVTVCGNFLVILSVIYFKQMHTPTNTLILSLAVADLLVGMFAFPLRMFLSLSACMYRYYVSLFCKIRDSFDILFSQCSILHLCCISVDRYHAVCQPLTYKSKINGRVVFFMIALSWGVSVFIAIALVNSRLTNDECQDMCFIDVVMTNIVGPLLSFFLPILIMLCIYLKIFVVAQRQVRSIQAKMKPGATVSKMERKATKTLAIVLGVFVFCWAPFFLFLSFKTVGNDSAPVHLIETVAWLGLANSTLNPFIYGFFYSWFRSAFKMIISGKILKGDYINLKLH
ncbi:trace amine-associated receptor 1-like [Cyprinodon tularosa]|uniref:trace amine-associated receptor 1-like n=1 Tax=Cyprinodon tularosa TaxID=77115 RepID=UPI0018E1FE72|nr:trace amine-associated receptor 1-like [Cyprinodon tularosa]